MSIASVITGFASGLISPVTNLFAKRNDNKTKITTKQIERLTNAEDKHAEWEAIQAENAPSTWKDEYITIIVTVPIPILFFGTIYAVYKGDPLIITAMKDGVAAIKELIPNYGELVSVVCLAGIGIKAFKK